VVDRDGNWLVLYASNRELDEENGGKKSVYDGFRI
jgi:hypothetical protein